MTKNILEDLFNAQSHLGHKSNRIHPKAKKYIYKMENGVSIIDLSKTVDLLDRATQFISLLGTQNKTLLFVATKRIAATKTRKLCQENNIAHITTKWPAGFLTNFETLMKNVKKLLSMQEAKNLGEWQKLVKHEQAELTKLLNKLQRFYGGLSTISKIPDALVIVDVKSEKNALVEAKTTGVKTIAIVDTNVDPDSVDYPIPANDDSETSITYILTTLIEAYVKGKKEIKEVKEVKVENKVKTAN